MKIHDTLITHDDCHCSSILKYLEKERFQLIHKPLSHRHTHSQWYIRQREREGEGGERER